MRRPIIVKEWRVIMGLCLLALVPMATLGVQLYRPVEWRLDTGRERGRSQGCYNNQPALWQAIQMYSQDNDAKFPPTTVSGLGTAGWPSLSLVSRKPPKGTLPVGWVDAMMPYFRSESLLMCPSAPQGQSSSPSKTGYTDYWMNQNLSKVSRQQIMSPTSTLLLGEGNDGVEVTNATYCRLYLTRG
jgi:hypothetical protein